MFNIIFSFAVGIGIIAILRPVCKGDTCNIIKAPPLTEWDGFIYRMGAKCYEYKSEIVECPKEGFIEGFEGAFAKRSSVIIS
jgi:hypothetical protein